MGVQNLGAFADLSSFAKSKLPNSVGVYFFKDANGKILYIGKSIRIRERILQHIMAAKSEEREARLCFQATSIDYELCGTELVALLHESQLIKKHLPLFNRAQRRSRGLWQLRAVKKASGFLDFVVERVDPQQKLLELTQFQKEFFSFRSATEEREQFLKSNSFCLDPGLGRACFWNQIDICRGACCGLEDSEIYNMRFTAAFNEKWDFKLGDRLIYGKGRKAGEKSFVVIQDSKLQGWGFVPSAQAKNSQTLERAIVPCNDNPDLQRILRAYFNENFKKALFQMLVEGEQVTAP